MMKVVKDPDQDLDQEVKSGREANQDPADQDQEVDHEVDLVIANLEVDHVVVHVIANLKADLEADQSHDLDPVLLLDLGHLVHVHVHKADRGVVLQQSQTDHDLHQGQELQDHHHVQSHGHVPGPQCRTDPGRALQQNLKGQPSLQPPVGQAVETDHVLQVVHQFVVKHRGLTLVLIQALLDQVQARIQSKRFFCPE